MNGPDPISAKADTPAHPRQRTVRSFVRRAGRLTTAQERALRELWPRYGLPDDGLLDFDAAFGRRAPRVLEIGFGNGDALLAHAAGHPHHDCIGIEVHEPGVGHCLLGIERRDLGNVRLLRHDAVEALRTQIPPGSLQRINLYFPDPWHKKRHHKRRLVQPPFVALVAAALAPGGEFHVATDWPPYAEHIAAVLAGNPGFHPLDEHGTGRARTRFEARGERLGHPIWERVYRRTAIDASVSVTTGANRDCIDPVVNGL